MFRMKDQVFALIVLIVIISGCSSKNAKLSKDVGASLRARESSKLTPHKLASPDGYFSTEIHSSGDLKIETDDPGFFKFSVPLNSESPAICFLYKERLDAGTTLNTIFNSATSDLKEKIISSVNAGVIEKNPSLALTVDYFVERNSEKLLGQFKSIFVSTNFNSVLCMHDEPGYQKTFASIVGDIIRNLKIGRQSYQQMAQYRDITIIKIQGISVGFADSNYYRDSDGSVSMLEFSSMLVPRSQTELLSTDAAVTEVATPSGLLESGKYISLVGKEKEFEIVLKKDQDGKVLISGSSQGKDFKSNPQIKSPMVGNFGETAAIKKLLQEKKNHVSKKLLYYAPDAKKTEPIEMTVEVVDFKEKKVKITFPSYSADATVDENGFVTKFKAMGENINIEGERAYSNGKL